MISTAGAISRLEAVSVVRSLRDYLKLRGLSPVDAAAGIGCEESAVSELLDALDGRRLTLSDERFADKATQALIAQLNQWIEEHNRKTDFEIPPQYVQTEVARRLIQVARLIRQTGKIGVATGPAGIGKSFVAEQLVHELPGTVVLRVNAGSRAPTGFIAAIAATFRVAGERSYRRPSLDTIIRRVRDTQRLLVIDQAHELSDASFRVIMALNDDARLPILLLGTIDIRARVSDEVDPEYQQLSSRIAARTELLPESFRSGTGSRKRQWLKLDEIRRIMDGGKVKLSDDALRMLHEAANFGPGFLRRAITLWQLADVIAFQSGARQITRNHINAASGIVLGAETSERVAAPATQAATA